MLGYLKNLILGDNQSEIDEKEISEEMRVRVATCALFLEIANSDDEISIEEENLIKKVMKNAFELSEYQVSELIELSEEQVKKSVSLYEFTETINANFKKEAKEAIVKHLWRLIYIDGKMNEYEEYFLRKISHNLHLEHADLIAAKLQVKKEMNIE